MLLSSKPKTNPKYVINIVNNISHNIIIGLQRHPAHDSPKYCITKLYTLLLKYIIKLQNIVIPNPVKQDTNTIIIAFVVSLSYLFTLYSHTKFKNMNPASVNTAKHINDMDKLIQLKYLLV